MTLDEFLAKLRETPRTWHLRRSRDIRFIRDSDAADCMYCPLTAVHGCQLLLSQYGVAAFRLGIDVELGERIARAADLIPGYDPLLRAKLLEACGL